MLMLVRIKHTLYLGLPAEMGYTCSSQLLRHTNKSKAGNESIQLATNAFKRSSLTIYALSPKRN